MDSVQTFLDPHPTPLKFGHQNRIILLSRVLSKGSTKKAYSKCPDTLEQYFNFNKNTLQKSFRQT